MAEGPTNRVQEGSTHRFKVDDRVRFVPDSGNQRRSSATYRVVRLMPPLGSDPQYRLRSEADSHEMVATEDQLVGVTSQETALDRAFKR